MKFFALAVVILGFSAASFGQNSDNTTATAQGTIVTPITILKNFDMQFGTLVAAAGTVVLNPGAAPTYSTVVAFTGAGTITPTPAKFTVSGDFDNPYTVNISGLPTVVTHTDGTTTMPLSAWSSTGNSVTFSAPTGTGIRTLDSSGEDIFEIGATLTVAGTTQKAGVYTSTTPFTVTVNYN